MNFMPRICFMIKITSKSVQGCYGGCNPHHLLRLSMLDRPLLLRMNLAIVETADLIMVFNAILTGRQCISEITAFALEYHGN